MYTLSGVQVDDQEGVPTVNDVAIVLGRLPRLCGSSRVWWTYLHYSYALAEIALLENRHYHFEDEDVVTQALIREAHSVCTLLWEPGREFKDELQARIHVEWGIPYPHIDSQMRELIDRAATRTFLAEVECFAPENMKRMPIFGDAGTDDCTIVRGIWHRNYKPEDSADDNAEMVLAYLRYFEKRDIGTLRHMVGYNRSPWFLDLLTE